MGDKTLPCLTPLETEKPTKRVLFQRTENFLSVYHEKSNLIEVTDSIKCLRGIRETSKHTRAIKIVATDDILN